VVWEVAERLFAALVIVGVFVEYGDKFLEFFHCPNVHTLGMIAGGALIAFGVLGEIWASSRGFKAERELDRENEKTIAELNREADREKAKLAELMLLSEWRTVGDLSAFEDAMRRFAGDQQYILQFAESEDKEPRQLMSQLHRALPNAGWIPIGETPRRSWTLQRGVSIRRVVRMPDPLFGSPAQNTPANWLDDRQIAVSVWAYEQEDLAPGTLVIDVGLRPTNIEEHRALRAEFSKVKRPVTPPPA
jgi:hypothetical protein